MTYKIFVTQNFELDLDAALSYSSDKLMNPVAAKNLLQLTEKAVSQIGENPTLYALYHDERLSKKGYHFVTVKNYLIFYRIDENEKVVHILRFLYGKQNVSDIF